LPTRLKERVDIALVIDAMDLLHSGRLDGFCLVSSDSDFTPPCVSSPGTGWLGSAWAQWVHRLANIACDFDPRTYGYRKLSDLVRKTGAFDIDQPEGRAMRISAKPKPPSKTRAKATAAR